MQKSLLGDGKYAPAADVKTSRPVTQAFVSSPGSKFFSSSDCIHKRPLCFFTSQPVTFTSSK
jgi:hypothetical protein